MIHQSTYFSFPQKAVAGLKMGLNLVQKKPQIFNLNVNCTNACNQQCPMCNAELETKDSSFLPAKKYEEYLNALKPYHPATCTLSGGEPTIIPELPQIIDLSVKYFPFGVALNSNFYSGNHRFQDNMTAALKAGIRISCSFDAFGNAANRQRGAKNVEEKTIENMKWVASKKKELGSKSMLIVHTVISDITIDHVEQIFDLSKELGFEQRIAPAINFYYQKSHHPDAPGLKPSAKLKQVLDHALNERGLKQNPHFIKGIYAYAKREAPKLCPYTTRPFETHKIFLDPNGDVSLCDRHPIGNLLENSFEEMLKTPIYAQKQKDHENCAGCWMACFVEPILAIQRHHKKTLATSYDKPVFEPQPNRMVDLPSIQI